MTKHRPIREDLRGTASWVLRPGTHDRISDDDLVLRRVCPQDRCVSTGEIASFEDVLRRLALISGWVSALTHIGGMQRSPSLATMEALALAPGLKCSECHWRRGGGMGQTVRFQEILRSLAIVDEGVVQDQAGLSLGLPGPSLLDPKTAALVQVGALVAIGAPGVCLEWGTTRALAAGASEDEITGVLLAIAPAAGLGRVVGAVTDVAGALGYDVEAALVDQADL